MRKIVECQSTRCPGALSVMWGRTYIWRQRARDVCRATERAACVEGQDSFLFSVSYFQSLILGAIGSDSVQALAIYMHVSKLWKRGASKNYFSDLLLLQPNLRAEGQNLASTMDRDYELRSRGLAILGPGALDKTSLLLSESFGGKVCKMNNKKSPSTIDHGRQSTNQNRKAVWESGSWSQ